MTLYELVRQLYSQCDANNLSLNKAKVFLCDENDYLHDIEVGFVPESFDGFDMVYPAAITLKIKPNT